MKKIIFALISIPILLFFTAPSSFAESDFSVTVPNKNITISEGTMGKVYKETLVKSLERLQSQDSSVVYSNGCRDGKQENCSFYHQLVKAGGCGRIFSDEQEKVCLNRGLREYSFFKFDKENKYSSVHTSGNKLSYNFKLFYFFDGNHTVSNKNGQDVFQLNLVNGREGFQIAGFNLVPNPEFHFEKSKYFYNMKNLESAIDECSIAVVMDRGNEQYQKKLEHYLDDIFLQNSSFDKNLALENVKNGFSPFYAQGGEIKEINYISSKFNKENASGAEKGLIVWGTLPYKGDEIPKADKTELLKFKFGEKKKLPEKNPRVTDFTKQ
ncbi:MAG: hypothetical protein HQK84_10645 [Nitrospinae bacterium]|nr:hypothetical protein [Nitrospinota bacterium]